MQRQFERDRQPEPPRRALHRILQRLRRKAPYFPCFRGEFQSCPLRFGGLLNNPILTGNVINPYPEKDS